MALNIQDVFCVCFTVEVQARRLQFLKHSYTYHLIDSKLAHAHMWYRNLHYDELIYWLVDWAKISKYFDNRFFKSFS